jgi:hypothetical protein
MRPETPDIWKQPHGAATPRELDSFVVTPESAVVAAASTPSPAHHMPMATPTHTISPALMTPVPAPAPLMEYGQPIDRTHGINESVEYGPSPGMMHLSSMNSIGSYGAGARPEKGMLSSTFVVGVQWTLIVVSW